MIQLLNLEIHCDNRSSLSLKFVVLIDVTTLPFVTLCVFSAFVLAYFKTHSLSDTLIVS